MKNPIQVCRNLYIKFKLWCLKKQIPFIIFPIAALFLLATVLVVIFGIIKHWNFKAMFVSPSACLVYACILAVIVLIIQWRVCGKR